MAYVQNLLINCILKYCMGMDSVAQLLMHTFETSFSAISL